jgi:1,4-alpha-glucan branching enzyme
MKKTTKAKAPAKTAKKRAAAKKPAAKSVIFTLHAEKGKKVCLAGQFNDWNPVAKKMAWKAKDDVYATTVKLAPGTYEYKFVVDGVWCADPANADSVRNDQGTFNSVITVK